jgi:hypothetical protein
VLIKFAKLIKPSTRQRCAKIGLSMDNVDMDQNANLPMVAMILITKNLKMKSTNQSLVNHLTRKVTACMENAVCLDMKIERFKKSLLFQMSTNFN